ncbi:interleukin-23 receptor isoform X1 [Micropterus dolomieu]|uniref:interleukin-23 receptor isoform X1 n=1 Tax=Micropterus dolomieu TaxID=147949 RepID=UPI001E8EF426|nr:interleukin-23 receptor isoform X1 [Micropterus dolomieu]
MHIEFGNDSTGAMLHWKSTESSDHLRSYVRLRTENGFWRAVEGTELSEGLIQMVGLRPLTEYEFQMRTCDFRPVLRKLTPAGNGSAVFVSWSSPGNKHWSASGGKLLHYVLEWTRVPAPVSVSVLWQKLAKDQNNTSITGLTAGVRYSISLYAVTTRGVSAPSSGLVYSKEQSKFHRCHMSPKQFIPTILSLKMKMFQHLSSSCDRFCKFLIYMLNSNHLVLLCVSEPGSSPKMSILVHKARRIWIQWDELPVDQQRGFITHYTIYLQILDSNNTEVSVTVAGSGPRQKWLDCPEGALALQLTASTSAGEGPRGSWISSRPATPVVQSVGLVIVIVFITFFIAIIANLMCWSCVRERIKQKCISWGPAWFDENLPKPGNSLAIRLLEQCGSEPSFPSTCSDPPLSPISFLSQDERDDEMMYPNIHVEISQVGSGLPTWDAPLSVSDTGTTLVDSRLEHVSYKPQIAVVASQGEEVKQTDEEQRDVPTSGEEERCSSAFGGLLSGLLSSVELEFSDSPLGLTLCSVGSVLQPTTPETTSVLDGGFSMGQRLAENNVEAASASLDLQPGETMTPDTADTCLSLYTLETTLTGGYFPQVAAVSSTTTCEAQR